MAEIKMKKPPTKPVREKREEALERLLLLACRIIPDDLSLLGDQETIDLASDVTSEAAFWLDLQPRGAKVTATSPELRLGYREVRERNAQWLPELDADGSLVPTPATPSAPTNGAAHATTNDGHKASSSMQAAHAKAAK